MDNQNTTQQVIKDESIPMELRGFLETIINDTGLTFTDAQAREEMVKQLYARLDNFISASIIKNLPSEHLEQFMKMTEEGKTQDEIQQYLAEKMPEASNVFAKTFVEFRELILGKVDESRNGQEQVTTNNQSNQ